jgi:hypothetical protein
MYLRLRPAHAGTRPLPMLAGVLTAFVVAVGQLSPAAGQSVHSAGEPVQVPPAPRWAVQPTPNAMLPNGTLTADSCSGPAVCMAVGSYSTSVGTSPLAEVRNGSAWHVLLPPVPGGAFHNVLTAVSCATASACVAVGYDTSVSGTQVPLAETWNGTAWSAQAPPGQPRAHRSVLAGVSCGTATWCLAVGNSTRSGVTSPLAETWNGTAWTMRHAAMPPDSVGSGFSGVSCASTTACTAVGGYRDLSSDLLVTLAERWNGRAWAVQPTPNPHTAIVSTLYGVSCPTSTACTAVGDFINRNGSGTSLGDTLAETWNGSVWTRQSTPGAAGLAGIASLSAVSCASAQACSAVGYYDTPPGESATTVLTEVWNGSTWVIQASADPGRYTNNLSGVSCTGASACTAVGRYRTDVGTSVTLAELGTNEAWTAEPTPNPPGAFPSTPDGVSCPTATACTAVGFNIDGPATKALALGWNGATWSIQHAADRPGVTHNRLSSVSCATPRACIAVGESFHSRSNPAPLTEVWNGSAWTLQHVPSPPGADGVLSGVSCVTAQACVAVGYYDNAGGAAEPLAERWNGTTWSIQHVPGAAGGNDFDLESVSCSAPAACTAVGLYDKPSGSVALAERWNGTAWSVQPTPSGDDILYGISCASATACTAVGESYSFPGPGAKIGPLAEAWNGSVWRVQATRKPPGATYFTEFHGVWCRSARDCAAVGGYFNGAGVAVPLAEIWNGTGWAIQPTTGFGDLNSALAAVSARPSGGFTGVGGRADAAQASRTLAEATR